MRSVIHGSEFIISLKGTRHKICVQGRHKRRISLVCSRDREVLFQIFTSHRSDQRIFQRELWRREPPLKRSRVPHGWISVRPPGEFSNLANSVAVKCHTPVTPETVLRFTQWKVREKTSLCWGLQVRYVCLIKGTVQRKLRWVKSGINR